MEDINVLSLFDGMSCGRIALEKVGINVKNYYASEVKPHAISVAKDNYPNNINIGDVTKLKYADGILYTENGEFNVGKIDLLIGGSPCQDLSLIKFGGKGLEGDKSSLFYQYLRVLLEVNPTYFLLENVASMKNIDKNKITEMMKVEPILINSNLVSAQDRRRYYWSNIPNITQPVDLGIKLCDIVEYGSKREEKFSIKKEAFVERKRKTMYVRVDGDKSMPITARGYSAWNTQFITDNGIIRDLTINEYKKLQTIPKWYKFDCIKSKATNLIGDGWTIDVIAHIFKGLKEEINDKH